MTFEAKLTVLRLYSNFLLDSSCRIHKEACKSVTIGLHMTLKTVLDIVGEFH